MSKTSNYQLTLWDWEDEKRLGEVNENFARLDAAAQVVTGTYTGNGAASQTVDLGFRPRAVLVVEDNGCTNSSSGVFGGLAVAEKNTDGITLADTGFAVYWAGGYSTFKVNLVDKVYHYMALR